MQTHILLGLLGVHMVVGEFGNISHFFQAFHNSVISAAQCTTGISKTNITNTYKAHASTIHNNSPWSYRWTIIWPQRIIANMFRDVCLPIKLGWLYHIHVISDLYLRYYRIIIYKRFILDSSWETVRFLLTFNIGSSIGLVPSGNKSLPEQMLAKLYVVIWRHGDNVWMIQLSTDPWHIYEIVKVFRRNQPFNQDPLTFPRYI